MDVFGGEEQLKVQMLRDDIKNKYCLNKGILLLFRISYMDDLNNKLEELIKIIKLL